MGTPQWPVSLWKALLGAPGAVLCLKVDLKEVANIEVAEDGVKILSATSDFLLIGNSLLMYVKWSAHKRSVPLTSTCCASSKPRSGILSVYIYQKNREQNRWKEHMNRTSGVFWTIGGSHFLVLPRRCGLCIRARVPSHIKSIMLTFSRSSQAPWCAEHILWIYRTVSCFLRAVLSLIYIFLTYLILCWWSFCFIVML